MKESINNLKFYFQQYESLKSDIQELEKAREELQDITGTLKAREVVSKELGLKRVEIQRLLDTKVKEV